MEPLPQCQLDDPLAMSVLADWLLERGDPRGALIQMQLAREASPEDQRLKGAEAYHLAVHAKELMGPLALHQSIVELRWRRGYVVAATLRSVAQLEWGFLGRGRRDVAEPVGRLPRAACDLKRLPASQHLTRVCLEQPYSRLVVPDFTRALQALRAAGLPLKELSLRTPEGPEVWGEVSQARAEPDRVSLDFDGLMVDCDARLVEMVQRALG